MAEECLARWGRFNSTIAPALKLTGERRLEYDKTYTTQEGSDVGEKGSDTGIGDRWFSRRHPKVGKKADFPRSRDSKVGTPNSEPFPKWSVWLPGEPFPEHPANRAGTRSAGQPKR